MTTPAEALDPGDEATGGDPTLRPVPRDLQREARVARMGGRIRSIEAAALAGIVYSISAVLALVTLWRYPSLSLSDAELTEWFDDVAHQRWLVGALALASVSAVAFLWFVAVIRRRLAEREDRFFATVFLCSGIAYVGVWLAGATVLAAPAVAMTRLQAAQINPASASLAGGLGAGFILVVAPRLQAVFIFTTSTVVLHSRILPSWLAFTGYAAGLAMFLAPLVSPVFAFVFPAWVLAVSVALLAVRPEAEGAAFPPT